MEIQYLALTDVGPFRGFHSFNFKSEKNKVGFAIFSKNGRGKTSLFNAMQWCLFGEVYERSRVVDGRRVRGRRRAIVGDDQPLMNEMAYESDEDPEMSVTIIASSKEGEIQVSRTARSKVGGLPRHDDALKIALVVKYGDKTESGASGQELIERFFPSEISRFFFIDGESLEEYVTLVKAGQVGGIKDDIEAVLKIPALTRGYDDLLEVRGEAFDDKRASNKRRKAARGRVRKGRAKEAELTDLTEALEGKKKIRERSKSKLAEIEESLSGYEEATAHITKIRSLRTKRESISTNLDRSSETRKNMAKNAWKVLIWRKAEGLHSVAEEMMKSAMDSQFQIDLNNKEITTMEEELSEWTGTCSHCKQPLVDAESHRESLKEGIREREEGVAALESGPSVPRNQLSANLGDLSKLNPPHGAMEVLQDSERAWVEDRSTLDNIIEQIEKEEGRGLQGVDEKGIMELYENKGKLRSSIRNIGNVIDELSSQVKLAEKEVRRLGGNTSVEPDYKERKIVDSMDRVLDTIEQTISKYREVARAEVEQRATAAFVKVINAPEALTGVILDEDFKAQIRGPKGKPIKAPSSGQEITMTLCVLDALRQTSGVSAPIFFDTPGRSLDEDHKRAQLEYFWKLRGHQFVIFPHSGEYKVDETIEEFGGQIGRAWELLWPVDYVDCPECGVPDPLKDENIMKCMSCRHTWDISSRDTVVKELVF